jgi:hypothetical protein
VKIDFATNIKVEESADIIDKNMHFVSGTHIPQKG